MVSFIPKHNLYHPVYCPESGHLKSFWHWESGGFWEAVVNASLWHSCCLAALGGALWGDRPPPCWHQDGFAKMAASSWGETGPRGWREIPKFDKAFDCK